MEAYQIKANEEFFNNVLGVLREGGKWIYPAAGKVFTKSGGKLTGDPAALDNVKEIVSEEYFKKYFGTIEN